jgi:hypothetical protein
VVWIERAIMENGVPIVELQHIIQWTGGKKRRHDSDDGTENGEIQAEKIMLVLWDQRASTKHVSG